MWSKLFITVIALFSLVKADNQLAQCTEGVQKLADDVFNLISSSMENKWIPNKEDFSDVLTNVQTIMKECANQDANLEAYQPCVDKIYPTLPDVEKAVQLGIAGQYEDMAVTITRVANELTEGIIFCINIGK